MSAGTQFSMLLWKNFLHQRRQKLSTFLEIFLPTMFCLVLVYIRQVVKVEPKPMSRFFPFQPNLVPYWPNVIAYTPNNSIEINELMTNAAGYINACELTENSNCSRRSPCKAIGFASEDDMVNKLNDDLLNKPIIENTWIGGVVFDSSSLINNAKIRYTIRMSATTRNPAVTKYGSSVDQYKPFDNEVGWQTTRAYPMFQKIGPRSPGDSFGGSPGYYFEGFLAIQYAIDMAIVDRMSNGTSKLDLAEIALQRYTYPPYMSDQFVLLIQSNLPAVVMCGFILIVLNVARNIVLEKEKRLKEFMKVMGLGNWLHCLAHFVWNFIFLFLTVCILTFLLMVPFGGRAIIHYASFLLIFVFLMVYAVAAICFCFAVSAFFSKGNTAAAFAGILWFGSYIPYFFIQPTYETMSYSMKMLSCISMNCAMGLGAQVLGYYEGEGVALTFQNIGSPATVDDNFSMLDVFVMLLADSALCFLVGWYVEGVYPGDDGLPLPWYFPFMPWYWTGKSRPVKNAKRASSVNPEKQAEAPLAFTVLSVDELWKTVTKTPISYAPDQLESYFEADPANLRAVIKIQNLSKSFDRKKPPAVNHIDLTMYEGQVTALLGHNGAGKSTTISILTGLIPPTKGTAFLNGYDCRTSMPAIRKVLGLCPQYNVLFDTLTVWEHLIFYSKLKGTPADKVDIEAEDMLRSLKMVNKRDALSKTLSGGMKRKLSVGIALIGDSKIVILDEPTAGMDPGARRSTWDLLQRERAGRTLLLTTHYMEEADLLGDRIAIMATGKIQCCGNSLFLKNRYGAGYRLNVVFEQSMSHDTSELNRLIIQHVPDARLDTIAGLEAVFVLPQSGVDRFERLFVELETQQKRLGIASFGVSVTTMEEVFLRVGEQASEKEKAAEMAHKGPKQAAPDAGKKSGDSETSSETADSDVELKLITSRRNDGLALLGQHLRAMLTKKILHSLRNWKVLLPQFIVPIILMCLIMIINVQLSGQSMGTSVPLTLNLKQFEELIPGGKSNGEQNRPVIAHISDPSTADWAAAYEGSLSGEPVDFVDVNKQYKPDGECTKALNVWKSHVNPIILARLNPAVFETELFKMTVFGNYTATKALARFNSRYIVGALYQRGNAIKEIASLIELDKISPNRSYQLSLLNDKYLNPNVTYSAIAFFNGQPYHSPAIALNALSNGLMRQFAGATSPLIEVVNQPLPPTLKDQIAEFRMKQLLSFNIAATFVCSTAFLSATFVIFLIRERQTNAKHLQFVSGVHPVTFWFANFVWDFVNVLVPFLAVLAVFAGFDVDAFVSSGSAFLQTLFLFVLYAAALLPYTYLASFFYKSPTIGFVKLTILNIVSGMGFMIIVGILEIPQLHLMPVRDALSWFFMFLSPHYCMGQALRDVHNNYLSYEVCGPFSSDAGFCEKSPQNSCCPTCTQGLCIKYSNNYLKWDDPGVGTRIMMLVMHIVVDAVIIFLVEMGYLRRIQYRFRTVRQFDTKTEEAKDRPMSNGVAMENGLPERQPALSLLPMPESIPRIRLNGTNITLSSSYGHPRSESDETEISFSTATSPTSPTTPTKLWSEYQLQNRPDSDVIHEREKVAKMHHGGHKKEAQGVLVLERLKKVYNNSLTAVNELSLCVEKGEFFGLLGVNGAGKTTTFKMLTGEENVSGGDAYVNGFSIRTQLKQARQSLGYCPQFDALIDQMTGLETLKMYARLRGIPESTIPTACTQILKALSLTPHATKLTSQYSGGNKRKLSIAIALLGSPPIVFLDEPTNGVDPIARRLIWKVLTRVRQSGIPLILTSHSMEECDALCTRLAIMVDGQFQCLGSPQHLKAKYGMGYTVAVKVDGIKQVKKTIRRMCNLFPAAVTVKDIHQRLIQFHVDNTHLPWSRVFGAIQGAKEKLHIVDYAISQTMLEQIFLNFCKGR